MSVSESDNTASSPVEMLNCVACQVPNAANTLDADFLCPVCSALESLRLTMEKRGTRRRELWDRQHRRREDHCLPPSDR